MKNYPFVTNLFISWMTALLMFPLCVLGETTFTSDVSSEDDPKYEMAAPYDPGVQPYDPLTDQRIEFYSYPSGVTIRLEGVVDLNGVTPFLLRNVPVSKYTLHIDEPGFEPEKSEITITHGSSAQFFFDIAKKSRLKAVLRSTVLPGWGQFYAEKKVRSSVLLPAGILSFLNLAGAAGYYAYTREEYREAEDEYRKATEFPEDHDEYQDEYRKNRDAWDYMRIAAAIYAGVWGLSFIDAVVDFPEFDMSHLDFSHRELSFSVVPRTGGKVEANVTYALPF
jgi:hypothetical protein